MKILSMLVLLAALATYCRAQDTTLTLTTRMFDSEQLLDLSKARGWVFKAGPNPEWANPNLATQEWTKRNPSSLTGNDAGPTGRAEGWFRLRVRLDSTFEGLSLATFSHSWAAVDLYVDGRLLASFGNTGANGKSFAEQYPYTPTAIPISLATSQNHLLALHVVDYLSPFSGDQLKSELEDETHKFIWIVGPRVIDMTQYSTKWNPVYRTLWVAVPLLLAILFWLLASQDLYERAVIRALAIGETWLVLYAVATFTDFIVEPSFIYEVVLFRLGNIAFSIAIAFLPISLLGILNYPLSRRLDWLLIGISVVGSSLDIYTDTSLASSIATIVEFVFFLSLLVWARKKLHGAQWAIVAGTFLTIGFVSGDVLLRFNGRFSIYFLPIETAFFLSLPFSFLVYIALRFKEIVLEDRAKAAAVIQITEEKQELLASQNERLEQQVAVRTAELKASQAQLIQKEKLASLGELTAGIAHEIQNPLNFVNNFSEVSSELVNELDEEQQKPHRDSELERELLADLKTNLQKINHHGGRASAIVKGMLAHSRTDSGEKRSTDLNALVNEYLQIAYHGFKAKDKDFVCQLITHFDPLVGQVDVVPQEIGRVLLNLYNNAFYAVSERQKQTITRDYQPQVEVTTKRQAKGEEIRLSDNGTGMAESVQTKIFQPFFTTKPTGEGTGLGLSLSYDIVTKGHGGTLTVESQVGSGSTFIIQLLQVTQSNNIA